MSEDYSETNDFAGCKPITYMYVAKLIRQSRASVQVRVICDFSTCTLHTIDLLLVHSLGFSLFPVNL